MTDKAQQLPGNGPPPWANRACPVMSRPAPSSLVDLSGKPKGFDVVPCLGPACALWIDLKDNDGNSRFAGCSHAAPTFLAVQQLQAAGALIGTIARLADVATARIHIEHPETKPLEAVAPAPKEG